MHPLILRLLLFCGLLLSGLSLAHGASPARFPATVVNPVTAPVKDNPDLPRVLLIWDSISIDYTLPVRKRLAGRAYGRTAAYDAAIATWFARALGEEAPRRRAPPPRQCCAM